MRLYYTFFLNEFQSNLAYKTDVFLRMFGRLMGLFVQIAVWIALYHSTDQASTGMGTIGLNDMIHYVIISTCISTFINNDTINRIGSQIRSGNIAFDLMKPISLQTSMLFQSMGSTMSRSLIELLPLLFVTALLYPLPLPNAAILVIFIISLFNGFLINFLISYILGMLGFWFISIYHLRRLLEGVIRLFSGVWIPLWFFPNLFNELSAFLPFRLIYFSPISIFLGKAGGADSLLIVLQQFLWIGMLSGISWFVWRSGVRKLVIQGG